MPRTKHFFFLLVYLVTQFSIEAQEKAQIMPIAEVLAEMGISHNIIFNYESDLLTDIKVIPLSKDLDLTSKIKNLEKQTNLIFNKVGSAIYTINKPIKLCGYIKDKYSQEALIGASVNGMSKHAISDDNGYFELDLKSPDELIYIRYIGFKTIERPVKFFNLEECAEIIMFEQQEAIAPVLLQTYLVEGINRKQDWTTFIDYSKFTLLPGLIESDVLQTVQALPSILSADETVSNINIRGGSNDQNLILWDDIKIYQTSHFFGLISSFNPHMTQTASIINNGTDVTYTDGVSGTLHMQTKKNIDSEFIGIFGVNFINAEIFSNIPVGKKSSVQIASRKSIDNFFRSPTYNAYFDRITQQTEAQDNETEVENSNHEFNFYDVSLRWLYNPTYKDFIRFNFINIDNSLSFRETATVDSTFKTRLSTVSQYSLSLGLNYERQWNDQLSTTFNIYNTDYKLKSENADVLANQLFLQENSVSETGIKIENKYKINRWQYKLGFDFAESEVINLNDIDLPKYVRRREKVLREQAFYGQAWYTNENNDLSVRGGIRANYLSKFQKLIVEPRLSVLKTVGEHIELEALGEYKHQSMSQIISFQNDFLGIEKRRWQIADNDSIPVLTSKQASVGILYKKNGWLIDGKAYYKKVNGITTQSQSFTTKYEFEKEKGSYNAYGVEFLFRQKIYKFNNWLSYSYIKNTYTFNNLEEKEFPSNFDITHSLTLGSTYSNNSWNVSAGVNYRLGQPTSIPLEGNVLVDDYVNFDRANNENLNHYLRLDASALYKFKLSEILRSEIGASIWNISNRENSINNYYRVSNNIVNRFSRFSLGLTTNVVFRLYF